MKTKDCQGCLAAEQNWVQACNGCFEEDADAEYSLDLDRLNPWEDFKMWITEAYTYRRDSGCYMGVLRYEDGQEIERYLGHESADLISKFREVFPEYHDYQGVSGEWPTPEIEITEE